MEFDFSADQHEIKRTARDLLTKRSTWETVRGHAEARTSDDTLYAELVGLGWPGIAIAEEHGGGGLGNVELTILAEELGFSMAVTPLLGTATAAGMLQHAGSDAQRARWLGGLASGELRGAVGVAGLVPDGPGADVVVLLDGKGGASLLDASQAEVVTLDAIDPTRGYASVAGEGETLTGDVAGGVARAQVAESAALVGVGQRALEMTLAYVKERKQFDTPVGAFQAVSHRCAQMLLHTESARSATYYAAWTADAAPERLLEGASLAKAAASDGIRDVTASAIQAHGGIGFTWEADVHWLYKRAQLGAVHLGGSGVHRALLARMAAAARAVATA